MTHTDPPGDPALNGHDALKSLGLYRVLTTYQLRFLHFPDMKPSELDALLASWRKGRLIGSKPLLKKGEAVHVLRPKGRMLLQLTEKEIPRVVARHIPKDSAALRRMILANDLTIAIRALRNTVGIETPWHPESVDFMQIDDPTDSQMLLTQFARQGNDITWHVRFLLDHCCEKLILSKYRAWRIALLDLNRTIPGPVLIVLSRQRSRTRAYQDLFAQTPGSGHRRAETLPCVVPGIPRILRYMEFVSELYGFLNPHSFWRPIPLPLGVWKI